MKKVHGKFSSFKDMGVAMGIREPKVKIEKDILCPRCGQKMHRVNGTNILACGNPFIIDAKLNEVEVQVFGESCPHMEVA